MTAGGGGGGWRNGIQGQQEGSYRATGRRRCVAYLSGVLRKSAKEVPEPCRAAGVPTTKAILPCKPCEVPWPALSEVFPTAAACASPRRSGD